MKNDDGSEVDSPSQIGQFVHFFTDDPRFQHNAVGRGPYAALVLRRTGGSQLEVQVFYRTSESAFRYPVHQSDLDAPQRRADEYWTPIPDADLLQITRAANALQADTGVLPDGWRFEPTSDPVAPGR